MFCGRRGVRRYGRVRRCQERKARHEGDSSSAAAVCRRRACARHLGKDDFLPLRKAPCRVHKGTEWSYIRKVGLSRELNDPGIFNNAAQAWNHDFYWHSLAPAGKGGEPSAGLLKAINESFGSLDNCKKALSHAATRQFGSGWAWLVAKGGKLLVESTSNADTPCRQQYVKPLLTIDVWEHAYYLDWQNNRAAYVKAIVDGHLNWSAASSRFASA